MKLYLKSLCIGLLISLSLNLTAQKISDFGDVPREDLAMTEFPEDPEADVVYLFDSGDLNLRKGNSKFFVTVERHVRIKILSEAGKAYANVRIPYWHEDKLDGIRAQTILPSGEKLKLKKTDIYKQQIKNTAYKTFTFPGVEVGAVIEYKYKLETAYIRYLEPWYFHNSAYTRVSRYSVTVIPYFQYSAFMLNDHRNQPEKQEVRDPYTKENLTRFTWTLNHLPPIRKEPYMRSLNDYRAALHFQIKQYSSLSQHLDFIKDWPTLAKEAREKYNHRMSRNKKLKTVIDRVIADSMDNEMKIRRIYEFVRDSIQTEKTYLRSYVETHTHEVLKASKGRASEKNLLLVNLLNLAGIESHPLLISTRKNGRLIELHPRLNQFNLVLAYVKDAEKVYVLDTRNPFCHFNLLPVEDIVEKGLVVDKGDGEFIDIPAPGQVNMAYCKMTAELDTFGRLKAEIMIRYEDYRAMNAREDIGKASEKEFVETLLFERYGGAKIDTFSIEGISTVGKPLIVRATFMVEDFAQVAGDLIYLSNPAMNRMKENVFKPAKRYYPVEYGFRLATRNDVTLKLPEGFLVEEIPASGGMNLKPEKLVFLKFWEHTANTIKVQRQMMIRKQEYSVEEYQVLREFYDYMVQADQGQIVLKKMAGME